MTNQKQVMGTMSLVTKSDGQQVIEFAPSNNFALAAIIKGVEILSIQESPDFKRENLAEYFRDSLLATKLPLTIYEMPNYYGVRSSSNKQTLIYWNYNTRSKYLNISTKTDILENGIITKLTIPKGIVIKQIDYNDFEEFCDEKIYDFFVRNINEFKVRLLQKISKQSPEILPYFEKYLKPIIEAGKFEKLLQVSLDSKSWKDYESALNKEWHYAESGTDNPNMHGNMYVGNFGPYGSESECLWHEMRGPFLDINDVIEEIKNADIAIPIDIDTRFPRTMRIRVTKKEEINDFLEQIIPQLEDSCTVPN
jgi:hypothetical protein